MLPKLSRLNYDVGANVFYGPIYEENKFKLQTGDIEKSIIPNTKAVFLNSPCNPIGAVLTKKNLEALRKWWWSIIWWQLPMRFMRKYIIIRCTNFSMSQIPEVKDKVLVVNSFFKNYALTGWRIGYIVGDKNLDIFNKEIIWNIIVNMKILKNALMKM